jgi:hypothetical protein
MLHYREVYSFLSPKALLLRNISTIAQHMFETLKAYMNVLRYFTMIVVLSKNMGISHMSSLRITTQ